MGWTTCHPQILGVEVHTSRQKHEVQCLNPWETPVNPKGSRQTLSPFDSKTVGSCPRVNAFQFCQCELTQCYRYRLGNSMAFLVFLRDILIVS